MSEPEQDDDFATFEAVAPLSSANIAPWDALTDTIDWSCPTHAFCNQCADDTEPGGINRYCVALMLKTSSVYPHLALFDHLESYWCWPEVWQAIEDASCFAAFSAKLNPRLAFEDRTTRKTYLGVVAGVVRGAFAIDSPLATRASCADAV